MTQVNKADAPIMASVTVVFTLGSGTKSVPLLINHSLSELTGIVKVYQC